MFIREKKNKIGTVSIQIIDKSCGSYRITKTAGSFSDPKEIPYLQRQTIPSFRPCPILPTRIGQTSIDFRSESTKEFVSNLKREKTSQVQVIL